MTDRFKKSNAKNNIERAWEIAINPRDYSKSERKALMQRGMGHYISNGKLHKEQLLADVSTFVLNALERKLKSEIVEDPPDFFDQPGKIALLMGLGSVITRRHEIIEEDPRNSRVHKHVRTYYLHLLYAAAKRGEKSTTIVKSTGELVYGRDQEDEYGPPPRSPIEAIAALEGMNGSYFKIPLVHANRNCEARRNGEQDGALECIIKGAYVYVPVNDVHEKYERYFNEGSVPRNIEEVVSKSISDEKLSSYQSSLTAVNEKIEYFSEKGHEDIILEERRYPADLEVILRSVKEVEKEIASLNEQLEASDVFDAVRTFTSDTDVKWIQRRGEKLDSVDAVSKKLSKYSRNEDLQHVKRIETERANKYKLEYMVSDAKQIDVSSIGDLMEFPCMESLHESLLEKKPVRWELYSFVRYVLELNDIDVTVEDIQEWFSQYDWHREDVTKYQVEYEQRQRMESGERPLPISCNNDNKNWANHCIGKENCEYSLYRSVDLKPDVYSRASGG